MHLQGESYVSPATGRTIHRQLFLPDGKTPAGHVILLHGLGDHLGCHLRAAELVCARGYTAVGVDWPGHGRSEGKRGHINGLAETFSLLDETLEWIEKESPSPPGKTAIYGHSTGGFVLLHYLRHRLGGTQQGKVSDSTLFDWIWLSSPLLRPDHDQPRLLVWAAPLLAKLAPNFTLDTKVRPERTRHTRGDESTAAGREMDGCHHWVNAAFGADLVHHGREINEVGPMITDPVRVLLTQGEEDTICPPEFSREFFDQIATSQKTYASLPGMRHEVLREPNNEPGIEAIENWLSDLN